MIDQFVVKLIRECNLRCTYCYYINDHTPEPGSRMPLELLELFLGKYERHCRIAGGEGFVSFHGGEPLMMGKEYFASAFSHKGFADGVLFPCLQTNALLIDRDWVTLFRNHNVSLGVSLDGPPEVHDKYRRLRSGRGSYAKTVERIRFVQDQGESVGVLAVIDPSADGAEVFHHLVSLGIKDMDFLLPMSSHAEAVVEPLDHVGITRYLMRAFLAWYEMDDPSVKVRLFRAMIRRYFGPTSGYTPIGISHPERIATLETDGMIAMAEELAASERLGLPGWYHTGFNIRDCSIDEAAAVMAARWASWLGNCLPTKCSGCSVNRICYGGNPGTRYDSDGSFDNPGVHCPSLFSFAKLIERVMDSLGHQPQSSKAVGAGRLLAVN